MNTFSRLAAFLLLLFAPVVQAQYSTGVPTGGSLSDVEAAKYIKLPGTYTAATLPGVYTVGLGTTAYTTDSGVVVATSVGWSPISSSGPLAPIPDGTLLGNSSGSTAAPSALTSPTISGTLTSGGLITSGSLKFSASSLSMSGTLGPTNSLLYMPGVSLSGAPPTPASGQISPMGLYLSGDAVDTTTTGNGNLIGLSVLDAPSAGFTGGRSAIQGYVAVVGTPTTLSSAGIVGVTSLTRVSANMTGATGAYTNYKGDTFGGNSNVFTTSGATFLKTVNGHEFDTAIVTGASAADHFGISIVKTANDALRGAYDDSAISVNDQDGVTVGWLYGISFGSYAHHWPFANDSTLIGAQLRQSGGAETDNALNGVDFRNVSFQAGGFAFASTGFTVNPSGAVTGTTLALNSTSCPSGNGLNTPFSAGIGFCVAGNSKFYASSSINVSVVPIQSAGTKFTTSGCSVSSTTGGAYAGVFTLGANSCTVVITMNGASGSTATNGWSCQAHDRTAPTVLIGGESSSTTTTASITIPAGAGATDVISFSCTGY